MKIFHKNPLATTNHQSDNNGILQKPKSQPADLERSLTGSITIDPLSDLSEDDDHDNGKQLFQFVASNVTDKATGQRLSAQEVVRGTTRQETIQFYVHQNIYNLQRHIVTTKKMGFAYIQVASTDLDMGNFQPSANDMVSFELPDETVPNSILVKGKYRIHISYTAATSPNVEQQHARKILREETVDFSII